MINLIYYTNRATRATHTARPVEPINKIDKPKAQHKDEASFWEVFYSMTEA